MTPARRALWVPSLLLGAAAATALATGAGILLYDDQGLFRARLVLVAVNVVSIVFGLRSARVHETEEDPLAGRWWLGFMLALLGAAGFAGAWEAMNGFAATPVAQGVGLGLTSALPAYCAAGTWARLGALEALVGPGARRQVTVGAAAGAVAGALLVVAFLGRPVWAVTAFLVAMVLASAGARLHVWILDRVPRLFLSLGDSERPRLRFEEWRTVLPENRTRVLREGRRDLALDPPPPGDWRRGVATTLEPGRPVLLVGVGSWFDQADGLEWRLYEADEVARALAAEGFGWEEAALAVSPVPETPGWVVVVDRDAASAVRLDALREAGVDRVWIGGRAGRLPESLLEEAREAGLGIERYRGAVAGVPGPPHVRPRADELWCLDFDGAPPESVAGMVVAPLFAQAPGDDREAASTPEVPGREIP